LGLGRKVAWLRRVERGVGIAGGAGARPPAEVRKMAINRNANNGDKLGKIK